MTTYTVFARKWRPQNFDEVRGQGHITTTLKNAIKLNRVAHAYLFSGPRGVGKTSIARIFAKALNCNDGPTESPCNKCSNCNEITAGNSLDVIEIDGASNRRIDDIREIGENVQFTPLNSRFKIYIIDEVHMLTKEAFNALLKTLEEPPAHVKFIFATTEAEKIIDTIISRCQKFEFRRIQTSDIISNLTDILSKEELQIDDKILFSIAGLSEGSMRDALSLLDQIVSYSDKAISTEDMESILGVIGSDAIFEFTKNIITSNTIECLNFIDSITKKGKDLYSFLLSIIRYTRELIIIKTFQDEAPGIIDLPKDDIDMARDMIKDVTMEKLVYIINVLLELDTKIKKHNMPRIPLEIGIIKLTHLEDLKSLKAILEILKGEMGSRKRLNATSASAIAEPYKKQAVVNRDISSNVVREDNVRSRMTPEKVSVPIIEEVEVLPKGSDITTCWDYLLRAVKKKTLPLGITLSKGSPLNLTDTKFTISFLEKDLFHKNNVEKEANQKIIKQVLKTLFGKDIEISVTLEKEIIKEQEIEPKKRVNNRELVESPIVKKALKMFDGRVVDVINK